MPKVLIKYRLAPDGQKASLLAGGDGKKEQALDIDTASPHFAEAVSRALIHTDGSATLDLTGYGYPSFDHIPTIEELLAVEPALQAAAAEKEAARVREIHDKTMEVLTTRKTARNTKVLGDTPFEFFKPDWPYYHDQDVVNSPEAQAWIAELKAANEVTELAYAQFLEARNAAVAKEEEEKKARRLAFRASLGLQDGEVCYKLEGEYLASVPAWTTSRRGKNWFAVIVSDPNSPGGLGRTFMEKCKGHLYYDISPLPMGSACEFGADDYSARGNKHPSRWYGVVLRRVGAEEGVEYLVFMPYDSGKAAIKSATKLVQARELAEKKEKAAAARSIEV